MKEHRDFTLFKKEFTKYQRLFGLNGWAIYFKYEPCVEDCMAATYLDFSNLTATVTLNSELADKDKPFKDIKGTAKHEAIHVLLGRLEGEARFRWATIEGIRETTEELVHKLLGLIG
ncbi:hypothetical protein LCGC14_1766890 [marine sediment metagenome]|uniref:SprT-like domain-containing protein n=1 Tax=marine sediment metagenome TaxID=412755 RepID=A0A0F9JZ40_9ZZZZ